ncbi:unnamed protein product [Haemonchus placei]|uniref:MFS transporter n=1 Tax=Haemonchus placei TaxID=6290 RepID=A0A0N4VUJ6_HAEPC|nr:unnamed protein product [Haemonchus placei]
MNAIDPADRPPMNQVRNSVFLFFFSALEFFFDFVVPLFTIPSRSNQPTTKVPYR